MKAKNLSLLVVGIMLIMIVMYFFVTGSSST
ncbi:hypothetical protein JOC58_003228 [Paenibacillus hunanensis]|uniref:Uncharacterized protein n=1 Tax=Paenibacillus hunanensis TaxID=539262 RepID=A0ABU1J1D9_9BACL|nr:hypothetical protein [Paenibacillus hunanensis]